MKKQEEIILEIFSDLRHFVYMEEFERVNKLIEILELIIKYNEINNRDTIKN